MSERTTPFDTNAQGNHVFCLNGYDHSWTMVALKILTLENKVDAWWRLHEVLCITDAKNARNICRFVGIKKIRKKSLMHDAMLSAKAKFLKTEQIICRDTDCSISTKKGQASRQTSVNCVWLIRSVGQRNDQLRLVVLFCLRCKAESRLLSILNCERSP